MAPPPVIFIQIPGASLYTKDGIIIQSNEVEMKRRCLPAIILLFFIWVDSSTASDSTLRCRNRLVGIGADKSEVLEKCGNPDNVSRWEEDPNSYISQIYDYEKDRYQAPRSIKGPLLMERWTYNFGSHRFIRYLDFENGELIKIETGEKGSD